MMTNPLDVLRSHISGAIARGEAEAIAGRPAFDYDEMTQHYVIAMLWSTTDESRDDGGDPLDSKYFPHDLTPEFMQKCHADCVAFADRGRQWLTESNLVGVRAGSSLEAMAGHDFWLTRNGHGAGFWDGDWLSDKGSEAPLSDLAREFGDVNPYVTNDGKIDA